MTYQSAMSKDLDMPRQSFADYLSEQGIEYEANVDLTVFTYLKTGGHAGLLIYPKSEAELQAAMKWIIAERLAYKVIGNTSNLLFKDDADYSVLVCTLKMTRLDYLPDERLFVAECGVALPDLSRRALLESVTGFEGFEGIPGTLGGGIFMNAGAYGYELKDVCVKADIIDEAGNLKTVPASELGLSHRSSRLRAAPNGWIVTRLYFKAEKGNASEIFGKMELYHAKRHKYTDYMYPNLGSIYSGSPYRALSKRDRVFGIYSALFYFFGYKFKIFIRESPINRKWLNNKVVERFGLKYKLQPFSDKTLNCLVNRGQGTDEMIRFIDEMNHLTAGRIPLENEIVEPF